MAILAAILGAVVGFLLAWLLQSKKINAEQEAATLEYDRGCKDEAGRRKHAEELLQKEIESLKDIQYQKLLVDTGRKVLSYFAEMKITNKYQVAFPTAEASTFTTLLNKYGEKNDSSHTADMLRFVQLIKEYNVIHKNRADVLLPIMQSGDIRKEKEWDDKLLEAAHKVGEFINGVITNTSLDD